MNQSDHPPDYYPSECEITQGILAMANARETCLAKAKAIRLLLLDVDGVLTDGTITYNQQGEEIKSFHSRDGFGITLLKKAGIEVGIITARESGAVLRRARDLSIHHVFLNITEKARAFEEIRAKLNLSAREIAYVGDDWLDIGVIVRVGFAVAVADADPEVKKLAHYVTKKEGGRGAVREVCNLILEAKGMRDALLNGYNR